MLIVLAVARGLPAVSICFELRVSWVVMGISTACMFICACGCGTHVYSTCTGPGHGLRTPYWTGCTARVNTGACLLHFACVCAVRCSAWIVRAVVYVECVCVCTVVGMCSSTCIPCTAFRMSARITCSYLVLVPLSYSASLGQPNAGKCA